MKEFKAILTLVTLCFGLVAGCSGCSGCGGFSEGEKSRSGVKIAEVKVHTDSNNRTIEQNNIIERITRDNTPGSVKHLYVISAYSGQVILYSPVRGKVTSSGKRLSPNYKVETHGSNYSPINIEALGDDGSYGNSSEYLYWFTPAGLYHQHYVSGGQIVHISDQPISVKNVIITVENAKAE